MVIQVYALTSNAEEAELKRFYEDRSPSLGMQPGALPFPRKELSPREALAVCTLPKPPAGRALSEGKEAPQAAFPSWCFPAQTKRRTEGIRVPATKGRKVYSDMNTYDTANVLLIVLLLIAKIASFS